jgi:hypothetical protein
MKIKKGSESGAFLSGRNAMACICVFLRAFWFGIGKVSGGSGSDAKKGQKGAGAKDAEDAGSEYGDWMRRAVNARARERLLLDHEVGALMATSGVVFDAHDPPAGTLLNRTCS